MGDKTGIQWTDTTWNPIRGCSRVSEGCRHCYAEVVAGRFCGDGMPYEGLIRQTAKAPRWNGQIKLVHEKYSDPLRWQKPRMVFVNSMSDLFHEAMPFEEVAALFGIMAGSPRHTFQVLTKRPKRAQAFFKWLEREVFEGHTQYDVCRTYAARRVGSMLASRMPNDCPWPAPNIWLGASIEDQATAVERITPLLSTPAALLWLSYEPALGPVDFEDVLRWVAFPLSVFKGGGQRTETPWKIDWVVVGGESGPGARPFHVEWARQTIRQARPHGTPVFVKQLGAAPYLDGEPMKLAAKKGDEPEEWPEDVRVRQWPGASNA